MFEILKDVAAAWRTIVHVSEWSGLSIGLLVVIVVLVYCVPSLRKAALIGAGVVFLGWLCVIHGDRVGRADVEAQWADARKAAIAADQDRDLLNELNLRSEYGSQLTTLERRAVDNKKRAEDAEHTSLGLLAKVAALRKSGGKPGGQAGGACKLGIASDRLRRPQG